MMLKNGLRIGLYAGALLIVYGLIYRVAGISPYSPLKWLFYVMLALACVLALRSYVANNAQTKALARMATGSVTAAVGSAAYAIYVFVYNRFVDDSLIRTIVTDGQQVADGDAKTLAFLETLSNPAAFAALVFVQLLVLGVLTSIVTAFIVRGRPAASSAP